jgi:ElaB/YqjD/DUF883 family membrane-anchored ribosome-binding protein
MEDISMTVTSKSFENGARNSESVVMELNRIVTQAEELMKTLGEEGGAAVEAVRQRVVRTVGQAKVRVADASARARVAANDAAQATDRYVHDNPWKAIAYGAAAGAVVAIVAAAALRRDE